MTALSLQQQLAESIYTALGTAFEAGQLGQLTQLPPRQSVVVEKPKVPEHGDYATPVAMSLAKPCRLAPLAIAEAIASYLASDEIGVEVAKPGFINLRLGHRFVAVELQNILELKGDYGRTVPQQPERILLEFVSANPTGPLHLGHGRWAALGSSLERILQFAGYTVDSEFYINDAGNQMQLLGLSLKQRYLQVLGEAVELPDGGYKGSYLKELAEQLVADKGDSLGGEPVEWFSAYAEGRLLEQQKITLQQFRTEFDRWYSERSLHCAGAIEAALADLEARGMLYRAARSRQEQSGEITGRSKKVQAPAAFEEEDGGGEALFFKAADFGDEMDRVVKRADGNTTYLAADIAYHWDKYQRGYGRLINIWGADHHGYVPRMKAVAQALGHPADSLEILIGQMVRLFKTNPETGQKEEMRMSKRRGELVSVDDLIEEVGVDAGRWFLLSQSLNTTVNFDLDLAQSEKFDNPVFYVQYNHARCCSILRKAPERGMPILERFEFLKPDGGLWLETPQERTLALRLLAAPDEYRFAAVDRTPQRLTQYAYDLASDVSQFYEHCPILPPLAENLEPALRYARLGLVVATRQVLATTLTLLGIEPRESM
ncbi:arginine--tRNA ligase [Gloeobacter violaceus]|uniref:Arginine--tRNA ligase n=1 Tax=Gloeobacter violaceus (strain ATCC 29082 / PCC 7421) TaxID=251221 RepID=SYR_GLOVI|nr:arginine--tRNA ligase [Gloeobacter violaceus]Q7NDF6.1 RecName: Full=Arginine--tRNA ligase; AltName: Full=Arginyl-tRNA synthetase; Short=ArgRS [Gloeobacter violaceus PCC 7421]BAC92220.1 arginyl-tRNA synthetase [Gloeobacter violaceus PCC 7421]